MTPARIQLIGRDNTVPTHMTDAQREQAEGPWEGEDCRPWTIWRFIGDMAMMIAAFGGLFVIGCLI